MLSRGLLVLAGLALAVPARADAVAVVKSARTGAWSDAATWDGGKVPTAGVKVLVREGHVVTYDVRSDVVFRSLHIAGVLTFAADKDTELNVGLVKIQHGETLDENGFDCVPHKDKPNAAPAGEQPGFTAPCLCCDGKPALLVGTPERPIAAGKRALIRLHHVAGMDKETCPAIVCCGGRMDFHGQPMGRTWVKLGADAKPGDAAVTLAETVAGWKVGDRVIVTSSGLKENRQSGTEEATITRLDGATVGLGAALKFAHAGTGDYRAEAANLTRNVVVESADPAGVRGHTMYHRGSAGSVSYAEFRHLGKEGVLGKYALHYHLCRDTMRGSSVVGASIWDSHNRWLTIHGTEYLVVRDCVGYRSVGHGFFLEDGTEVYNVLDRNLAVRATEGRPLPKQVLPFDKNDGAGFWWANSHNAFTRNVAADCGQYGFRFDAEPKAGTRLGKEAFGDPSLPFDLALPVRRPDGTSEPADVRTLPFVRFEGNESHGHAKWGLNLGQHTGGKVGPDAATPFHLRDTKVWAVVGGWGVEVPNVLVDGLTIHATAYGVRESAFVAQDYRRVAFSKIRGHIDVATLEDYHKAGTAGEGHNRVRLPGWPAGRGDGGARFQPAEVEVAKLAPVDKLPPQTVVTHLRRDGDRLVVRGTTADDGTVTSVTVNGQRATATRDNFAEWEAAFDQVAAGPFVVKAAATDAAGNTEKTPHAVTVRVR